MGQAQSLRDLGYLWQRETTATVGFKLFSVREAGLKPGEGCVGEAKVVRQMGEETSVGDSVRVCRKVQEE